jgi:hypothetical protein
MLSPRTYRALLSSGKKSRSQRPTALRLTKSGLSLSPESKSPPKNVGGRRMIRFGSMAMDMSDTTETSATSSESSEDEQKWRVELIKKSPDTFLSPVCCTIHSLITIACNSRNPKHTRTRTQPVRHTAILLSSSAVYCRKCRIYGTRPSCNQTEEVLEGLARGKAACLRS